MAWQEMTWEYIAGFMDGEGSLEYRIVHFKNGNSGLLARVQIYQNTREVLDEIVDFVAQHGVVAKVRTHVRPDRVSKGHKGSYTLVISGARNFFLFMTEIEPFLRVKRLRAVEAIAAVQARCDAVANGEITDGRVVRAYDQERW